MLPKSWIFWKNNPVEGTEANGDNQANGENQADREDQADEGNGNPELPAWLKSVKKCKLLWKGIVPIAVFAGFILLLSFTCDEYHNFPSHERCIENQGNSTDGEASTELGSLPTSSLAGQSIALYDPRSHISVQMGYWNESNTSHALGYSVFTLVEVGGGKEVKLKSPIVSQDQAVGDEATQEPSVNCDQLYEDLKIKEYFSSVLLGVLLAYVPWLFDSAIYQHLIAVFYLLGASAFFTVCLILNSFKPTKFLNEWFIVTACGAVCGCFVVAATSTIVGIYQADRPARPQNAAANNV